MYTISFKDVGGTKANFSISKDTQPDYNDLYGAVRRHLLSSEIDFFTDNEQEDGTCTGWVVVGGFRPVGEFAITKETPPA